VFNGQKPSNAIVQPGLQNQRFFSLFQKNFNLIATAARSVCKITIFFGKLIKYFFVFMTDKIALPLFIFNNICCCSLDILR